MRISFCLFFISIFVYSQEHIPSNINRVVGLPDTLSTNEVRVYKRYSITNATEVFRLFEYTKEKWKAEFYHYYSAVPSANVEEHYDKMKLITDVNLNFTWNDIINTHVLFLPDMEKISYKLKRPQKISYDQKTGYAYEWTSGMILDGIGYEIFIKSVERQNHISYANPKSYLETFPDVDELISIHQLLEIVRDNFKIWKD